jgi:hypothetical protein
VCARINIIEIKRKASLSNANQISMSPNPNSLRSPITYHVTHTVNQISLEGDLRISLSPPPNQATGEITPNSGRESLV